MAKNKVGLKLKEQLDSTEGLETYLVLGFTPTLGEGGFSIAQGEAAMVASLLVSFFRDHPDVLMTVFSTMINMSLLVSTEQLEKEMIERGVMEGQESGKCNCPSCAKAGSEPAIMGKVKF